MEESGVEGPKASENRSTLEGDNTVKLTTKDIKKDTLAICVAFLTWSSIT